MALLDKLKNGKHWNARTLAERPLSATKKEADVEFHVGWVNYLDENGDWQEIDCNYVEVADGFEVTEAPFKFHAPLFADGVASFESNVRFDVFTKNDIKDASMTQTLKAVEAQHVKGELFDLDDNGRSDAVIYKQAFPQWDADLIYFVHHGRAPRLKKLVRFNSAPVSDLQVNFEIGYNRNASFETLDKSEEMVNGKEERKVVKTAWNEAKKITSKDGFSVKASTAKSDKRGVGMKEFYIWDSEERVAEGKGRSVQKIDVDFEKIGQRKYRLTKNIPASFFAGAVLPVFTDTTTTFYPDPDAETTSCDGSVGGDSASNWTNARAGSGYTLNSHVSNASSDIQGESLSGSQYNLRRHFFLYDTSAITSGATISAATHSIYSLKNTEYNNSETGNPPNPALVATTPASNTNLTTSDFGNVGTTRFADTDITMTALGVAEQYNDQTLNATGLAAISKTSITKLGMRSANDFSNGTAPTQRSYCLYALAETTGTSKDPKLVVTFTTSVDITVNASVLAATFSTQAPTESGGASVAPAVLSAVFSAQTRTVSGGATVSPSVLAATFSIPTVNIITPDAQVLVSAPLSAVFSTPAPTVSGNAPVAIGAPLAATFSQPAATFKGDVAPVPSVLSATFSTPAPTIIAIGNISIAASVLTATFSLPSRTVVAEQNASTSVGVLSAIFTTQAPTVTAIQNVSLTATTLVATFSVNTPRKVGGLWTAQPRVNGDAEWTPQARAV